MMITELAESCAVVGCAPICAFKQIFSICKVKPAVRHRGLNDRLQAAPNICTISRSVNHLIGKCWPAPPCAGFSFYSLTAALAKQTAASRSSMGWHRGANHGWNTEQNDNLVLFPAAYLRLDSAVPVIMQKLRKGECSRVEIWILSDNVKRKLNNAKTRQKT